MPGTLAELPLSEGPRPLVQPMNKLVQRELKPMAMGGQRCAAIDSSRGGGLSKPFSPW